MNGFWFLQTHNRPERAKQVIEALVKCGTSTPGYIVVNGGEQPKEYDDLPAMLPEGWKMIRLPEAMPSEHGWNWIYDNFPGLDWYGLLCDDLVPRTQNWDTRLLASASPDLIVSSDDGWQAPNRMHGATIFGGNVLRAAGWFFPRDLEHMYGDDVWEGVGRATGRWHVNMNVLVEHMHFGNGKAEKDDSYVASEARMRRDGAAYERFLRDEAPGLIERLGRKKAGAVDVSGKMVFIATPTLDGNLRDIYLHGIADMIAKFMSAGVGFALRTLAGESDLERGRNFLLHEFMQSSATHLLFIDSDMGFRGEDAMRLLASGKDVCGAAGVRKQRGPKTFCVNVSEINQCPTSGFLRVKEIGTGFLLISRAAIEKMLEAYPDSYFVDRLTRRRYPDLFRKIREDDGTAWSEDFSFCKRWTALGGEVWVDQMANLGHAGTRVWSGRMHDYLIPELLEKRNAEDAAEEAALDGRSPTMKEAAE